MGQCVARRSAASAESFVGTSPQHLPDSSTPVHSEIAVSPFSRSRNPQRVGDTNIRHISQPVPSPAKEPLKNKLSCALDMKETYEPGKTVPLGSIHVFSGPYRLSPKKVLKSSKIFAYQRPPVEVENAFNNNNTDNYYNSNINTSKDSLDVKNINLIREELRARRDLFFSNSNSRPHLVLEAKTEGQVTMNNREKTSRFGFKYSSQEKSPTAFAQGRSKVQQPSNVPCVSRLTEISLPKLYSVHTIQPLRCSQTSRLNQPTSHVPVKVQHTKFTTSELTNKSHLGDGDTVKLSNMNQKTACFGDGSQNWLASSPRSLTHKPASKPNTRPGRDHTNIKHASEGNCDLSPRRTYASKLPTYNMGARKSAETSPFDTTNDKSRNFLSSSAGATDNTSPHMSGVSGVSTGVVKQRTIQYQNKIAALSTNNTPLSSPLIRSATYVKSMNPNRESKTPVIGVQARFDCSPSKKQEHGVNANRQADRQHFLYTPTPVSSRNTPRYSPVKHGDNKKNLSVSKTQAIKSIPQTCTRKSLNICTQKTNFPLARGSSTSSSVISNVSSNEENSSTGSIYVAPEADKAISDSEFLIDDEISDQPDLTLTYKDSPMMHSQSSSGESLMSCGLLMDHEEGITPVLPLPPSSPKFVPQPGTPNRNERLMSDKEAQEKSPPSYSPVIGNFINDILTEVLECKMQLKKLLSALETSEKERCEKDDVIRKQQKEIEFLKSKSRTETAERFNHNCKLCNVKMHV